jgi:small GTP-binding protein
MKISLIYAKEDFRNFQVQNIVELLESLNDVDDIYYQHKPAEESYNILDKIREYIFESDLIIIICSKVAQHSTYVRNVVEFLRKNHILRPIIPIYKNIHSVRKLLKVTNGIKYKEHIPDIITEIKETIEYVSKKLENQTIIRNEHKIEPSRPTQIQIQSSIGSTPAIKKTTRIISKPDYVLKILLIGPLDSGKTDLIVPHVDSHFGTNYKLTVGLDILVKHLDLSSNLHVSLSIWDIGSAERFNFIRSMFYKGASAMILVFNRKSSQSWSSIQNWYDEIRENLKEIPFILIGNYVDEALNDGDLIDNGEIIDFAQNNRGFYIETNSTTDILDVDLFNELVRRTITHYDEFDWSPSRLIKKLSEGKSLKNYEYSHPKLGSAIHYILEKIENIHNPIANEFRNWAENEYSVKIGEFRILL